MTARIYVNVNRSDLLATKPCVMQRWRTDTPGETGGRAYDLVRGIEHWQLSYLLAYWTASPGARNAKIQPVSGLVRSTVPVDLLSIFGMNLPNKEGFQPG